jgi:DNA-binding CsgD family transcriptional regulator
VVLAFVACLREDRATAATHVQHILDKTGTTSRAELAAYATRRGILP